ncbi:LamG domain-containing protein [Haloferula rosea]|uniref:LamG domain-containing protein n=1 Tax=Haloferula rosea TaxID=490093 RepID=A0A934RFN3_9BACT|nr:LamG domain-containing protein [Haloferula rosea]MBK1828309.1 LamG domain-containing protein [Haloferula rosea]
MKIPCFPTTSGLRSLLAAGVMGSACAATPLSPLMPRTGDFTSMWWAEGFPGTTEGAPWLRCIQTGHYAMVLDTEAMRINQLGPVPKGSDYATFGKTPGTSWGAPSPADLSLVLSTNGKRYRCREGGKWSRHGGPRLIESGRIFQRGDVTDLVFAADDGERLNVEARFETAAWPDRLGLIFAARPGFQSIRAGESSFGKVGGGFGLDGSNHFEVAHDPGLDPEKFTLELWAFVPTHHNLSKHSTAWLVCKNRNEAADGSFGITLQRGVPHARLNIGGGREGQFTVKADSPHSLKLDAWNHLAMSYDGDSLRLYVNGRAVGSEKIGLKRTPGRDPLVFGRRGDNHGDGYHFRGVVDEIRLHDRALSAQEVRQAFTRPESPRPSARGWSFRTDGLACESAPREVWRDVSMEMKLSTADGALSLMDRWAQAKDQTWSSDEWRQVALALDPVSFEEEPATNPVKVSASSSGNRRAVKYEPTLGWHRINLDGIEPEVPDGVKPPSNDAIERVKLVLSNPTDREEVARLMFEKTAGGIKQRIGSPITGISAMLRDVEGNPTGIPVQLSKNWHNDPAGGVYSGMWFHGISQIHMPPSSRVELELVISYGHWGGLPAASHAQLSLVGWGSNQLWHQSALGAWGESICYEPDQVQANCTITDVRPALVKAGKDAKPWKWSGNMGGGDFFRLFDPSGKRVAHSAMRTTATRQGPCLTEVTYSGRLGKGVIHSSTVSLARTDDIVRGTYRLRLDVQEATDFSRFVVFQVGADTYNSTKERKMALGNETGLIKEWDTQWGGNKYRTQPIACSGATPWISLHQRVVDPQDKHASGANRGIVIRSWNARIGGKECPVWIAERGLTRGRSDSSTIDLLPPPGVTRLEPGDFIEATIEHLMIPQFASDYYGPNTSLRAALAENEDSWRMVSREAIENHREATLKIGRLIQAYPDLRIETENDEAEFILSGGLGHVPVTLTQLSSSTAGTLLVDGQPLDQSVHGRDFWQTDYDAKTRRWTRTYNIPATRKSSQLIQFKSE